MTVNFYFSILYELHGKKPKRPIGNHFPQWNWLGGDHWFGDGPAMAVWQLVWAHLYIHGCPRTRSPETGAHSVYSLAVCERCASVPSPLRNVINPGSDRQRQIPGCHSKRSGKAVCSLVYFWLWNLCLLRNREGIHAEKSDVGLKKRQKALNSARFTHLFHSTPGPHPRNVLHCYIRWVPIAHTFISFCSEMDSAQKRRAGTGLAPPMAKKKGICRNGQFPSMGYVPSSSSFHLTLQKKPLKAQPTSSSHKWGFEHLGPRSASLFTQSSKRTPVCQRLHMKSTEQSAFRRACYRTRKPLEITLFELGIMYQNVSKLECTKAIFLSK